MIIDIQPSHAVTDLTKKDLLEREMTTDFKNDFGKWQGKFIKITIAEKINDFVVANFRLFYFINMTFVFTDVDNIRTLERICLLKNIDYYTDNDGLVVFFFSGYKHAKKLFNVIYENQYNKKMLRKCFGWFSLTNKTFLFLMKRKNETFQEIFQRKIDEK